MNSSTDPGRQLESLIAALEEAALYGVQDTMGADRWSALVKRVQDKLSVVSTPEELDELAGGVQLAMQRHTAELLKGRQERFKRKELKARLKKYVSIPVETPKIPLDKQITPEDVKSVFGVE